MAVVCSGGMKHCGWVVSLPSHLQITLSLTPDQQPIQIYPFESCARCQRRPFICHSFMVFNVCHSPLEKIESPRSPLGCAGLLLPEPKETSILPSVSSINSLPGTKNGRFKGFHTTGAGTILKIPLFG